MKKRNAFVTTVTLLFFALPAAFAQSSNQSLSQNPAQNGFFLTKAINSCLGHGSSKATVYAVVNRADWCLVCQKNSDRIESILPRYKNKAVAFIPNDLTDEQSKKHSAKYLKKLHILSTLDTIKETGMLVLIDAKSHHVTKKISLSSSTDEIEKSIDEALSAHN